MKLTLKWENSRFDWNISADFVLLCDLRWNTCNTVYTQVMSTSHHLRRSLLDRDRCSITALLSLQLNWSACLRSGRWLIVREEQEGVFWWGITQWGIEERSVVNPVAPSWGWLQLKMIKRMRMEAAAISWFFSDASQVMLLVHNLLFRPD